MNRQRYRVFQYKTKPAAPVKTGACFKLRPGRKENTPDDNYRA